MLKKILHGLDGSEGAFKALVEALELAQKCSAELHTISVEELPRYPGAIGEVIEEKVVERVGNNRPIPIDIRIITATNRDLRALIAGGRFREDFFYFPFQVSQVFFFRCFISYRVETILNYRSNRKPF